MKALPTLPLWTLLALPTIGLAQPPRDIPVRLNLMESVTPTPLVFIFPGTFDIYTVEATNPNADPITALDLRIESDPDGFGFYSQAGISFQQGTETTVVFGFLAPDTFFVLPDGVDPPEVCVGSCAIDTPEELAASFATSIPGGATEPIIVIAVAENDPVSLPAILGTATVGGERVNVVAVPEPTAAAIAALSLLAWVTPRRR